MSIETHYKIYEAGESILNTPGKMAVSAAIVMACAAEGRSHTFAENLVSKSGIYADELALALFALQGSRLKPDVSTPVLSAGAFPLSHLEARIQEEAIRPAAKLMDELSVIRNQAAEIISSEIRFF